MITSRHSFFLIRKKNFKSLIASSTYKRQCADPVHVVNERLPESLCTHAQVPCAKPQEAYQHAQFRQLGYSAAFDKGIKAFYFMLQPQASLMCQESVVTRSEGCVPLNNASSLVNGLETRSYDCFKYYIAIAQRHRTPPF